MNAAVPVSLLARLDRPAVVHTDPGRRPGPNDLLPCPSESSRRRHVALCQHCDRCGVEGLTGRSA